MKQPSKRFLSLLLGVALLAASAVMVLQFIRPAYDEARQLKAELFSLKSLLDKEKGAVVKVQELLKDYAKSEQRELQKQVDLVLPPKPDLTGAVAQVYGLALINNLKFTGISFSVGGLTSAPRVQSLTPITIDAALRRPVGTVTLSTSLSGSYDDIKKFISHLSTNIRIFDLKTLAISPPRGEAKIAPGAIGQATSTPAAATTTVVGVPPEAQSANLYSISITIATYYQGE